MKPIKTAGLFLINNRNELLLAHPTNHPDDFWSITKGKLEKNEDSLTCALRETYEESNVDLRDKILNYHKLPTQLFKNGKKRLRGYIIFEVENNIDFSSFTFKCNSYVDNESGYFPEMDGWKWLDINKCSGYVHDTQSKCIDIIKDIIKNNEYRKPIKEIY